MKITSIKSLDNYQGTVLIPVIETGEKHLVPIEFNGVSVPSKVFYGRKDSTYAVANGDSVYLFAGLGKDQNTDLKTIFRRIAAKQKELFAGNVTLALTFEVSEQQVFEIVSGIMLGSYATAHFKNVEPHPILREGFELRILSSHDYTEIATRAVTGAMIQKDIMKLVDLPPNVCTPDYISQWAASKANELGFDVTILDKQQAADAKLEAFLAVGQGSNREPRFLIMEYSNAGNRTPHVGLVGKGVTFDTGGLNIKTSAMLHMKSDMAGGAAVIGTMCLVSALKLEAHVTAIVPLCENAVGAKSFYPGDVISSYSGHSIEVIDTDAEGRLILADGLSYLIKKHKPDTIVDIATLTGSSVATFGYECGALFTNNESLAEQITSAAEKSGERVWQLPLWDAYRPDIESDIADVRNYSGKPVAGAITAAKFLEYFTQGHKSWAHLDIAGVAYGDDEFSKSKHATGYGIQLLTTFIENVK